MDVANEANHYTSVCCGAPTDCMPDGAKARAQSFFQGLADSTRPVHCSEARRAFVTELLNRAQEAGLYAPAQTT